MAHTEIVISPETLSCHTCGCDVICDDLCIPRSMCAHCGEACCSDCRTDGMCPECFMAEHPHHFVAYRFRNQCIVQRSRPPVKQAFTCMRDAMDFIRNQPVVAAGFISDESLIRAIGGGE